MDEAADYLSNAQYCWEKAQQTTALDRERWLEIANGFMRLHRESEVQRAAKALQQAAKPLQQAAKPLKALKQSVAVRSTSALRNSQPDGDPPSVDFTQFSLVDRPLRSSRSVAREQSSPPRRGLGALIKRL
jgi:hypothetical protein